MNKIKKFPSWIEHLEPEDLSFIKKFILVSGSLKDMAKAYGVSYPTVRLRLDKLIQKIKVTDDVEQEPYIGLIKQLAVDEKIDFEVAKLLISEYRNQTEHHKNGGEI